MNKGVIVAICIIVIVAAVGIMVSRGGKSEGPRDVGGEKIRLIDKNTLAIEELTLDEWAKRGADASGAYKNAAGEYTMRPVQKCSNCGAEIPALLPPPIVPDREEEVTAALEEAYEKEARNYKCPKCGKKIPVAGI